MALDYNEIVKFMKEFGVDFLNQYGELIIDEDTNTYAIIESCKNIEDVELYVTFALCRPTGKGLEVRKANELLMRFNNYFKTKLTRSDMRLMYSELCYRHKLDNFRDFIKCGFPIEELKTEEDYR